MRPITRDVKIKLWKLFVCLGMALLTYCMVPAALSSKYLTELEQRTWDWRAALVADPSDIDPNIKIIALDQSSLEYGAEDGTYWPWPRTMYEPVVRFLEHARARTVTFDILFEHYLNSEPNGESAKFAKAVGSGPPSIAATMLRKHGRPRAPDSLSLFERKQRSVYDEAVRLRYGLGSSYRAINLPFPELVSEVTALGDVSATPDSDGVFRRVPVAGYFRDTPVLGLAFATFRVAHPDTDIFPYISEVRARDGRVTLRPYGPSATFPTYSMYAVIQSYLAVREGKTPAIPLSTFENAVVFVGMTAPGLLDLRPTSIAPMFSGVELHATAYNNLIDRSFVRDAPSNAVRHVCWMLALIGSGLAVYLRSFTRQILATLLAAASGIVALSYLAEINVWFPAVVPLLALISGSCVGFFLSYVVEGQQHRFIKDAFRHYVTPEVIDRIVRDPAQLKLGGEKRDLTIFFSDIAGFTTLSEQLEPPVLVKFLNHFLSEMTDIVLERGGTIDKYEGDAIIAFWNAPLDVSNHQMQGVRAGLQCQARLRELAPIFRREYGIEIRMRIGIHTGPVTAGNFGSRTRFNYTIIGDAANLASRLEGVNKVFGTDILVSEATMNACGPEIHFRKVGQVAVVGRAESVQIFEPLADALDTAHGEAFRQAMNAFESGRLDAAHSMFQSLENDPVSRAYIGRIIAAKSHHAGDESSFDPVWNLTSK